MQCCKRVDSDAARWWGNQLRTARTLVANSWVTHALGSTNEHLERALIDDEPVLPLFRRMEHLTASYSRDHRHALQNWLLIRVSSRRPAIAESVLQVLAAWPEAPASRSPSSIHCEARDRAERRLHEAFEQLCATAFARESFPSLWALRADGTMLRPGQVRLGLHCDGVRFVIEINPHFTPSAPLLAHVLLHEMEHVCQLCRPPCPAALLDPHGHGPSFDASFAAHLAAAEQAGVVVHEPPFGTCGRDLPPWWADAVRTVLSARQRARFEAAIALEAPSASPSLSGADLFDVMAADLDCSVEQIAAAYLGCVVVPGKARADATIAE